MRQALRETPADHRRGGADAAAQRGSGRLITLIRRIHLRALSGRWAQQVFCARQAAALAVWSILRRLALPPACSASPCSRTLDGLNIGSPRPGPGAPQ